ncbi:paramyosin [Linepithema humile]|uniref:paramyosin n=1 Tax=Linepithema humile TaxID=83485 RepID=UPI0006236418|nr:PREDICTED: protein Spindly [Linepithema humile]
MSECEKYENMDVTIEKHVEKLTQEQEILQQQLHVLRLKVETHNALEKEFQESNKVLEDSLAECRIQTQKILAEKERNHTAEKKEYENYIATLETDTTKYKQEIERLLKELKKYKDLVNQQSHDSTYMDDNSAIYKKETEILATLLENESKKTTQLEIKLKNVESHCEELKDILRVTKNQLEDKNEILESVREELAVCRMELASLKVTPASDTRKGNSLFAEVEDERKKLLDNLKGLQNKYQEAKQEINSKSIEIKILKAENNAMFRKWENSEIDTLQEKANLLEMYKSRVFNLETKLKAEMKKNNQKEIESVNNDFNYAQLLLNTKIKEIKHLNEKLEMQTTQMLVQEEVKHDISKQLRYWFSKAKSLEAEILIMKTQLKTAAENDNIDMSETDCQITNTDFKKDFKEDFKEDFEKKHLKVTFDDYALNETEDKENKPLKKQPQDYRKIVISKNP